MRRRRDASPLSFDFELFADDPAKRIPDLAVPWHGRLAAIPGVQKEIVSAAVAMEEATFLCELAQKGRSLHAGTSISLNWAAGCGSERASSTTSS